MSGKPRIVAALVALVCAAFVVRTVVQVSERPPQYNWDMVPYAALALAWTEDDPAQLHKRTYEILQAELPPQVFAGQIVAGGVRRARFENPEAFTQHLAFYRARVLYTGTVRVMHSVFGMPLSSATWWVGRISWVLLTLLIVAWSARALGWSLGTPVGVLFAHAPFFVGQLGASTPDMLATLLTCAGVFVFTELRRDALGLAILGATLLVRPDTVILAGLLIPALWFFDPGRPGTRTLAAFGVGVLALYFAVQRFGGAYGWWPLFWISFVRKEELPAALATAPDWGVYFRVLREQLATIPAAAYERTGAGVRGSIAPLPFLGLLLATVELARRFGREAFGRPRAVLLAFAAAYALRWLLFPALWDRFFAPLYVCVPLILLTVLTRRAQAAPALVRA